LNIPIFRDYSIRRQVIAILRPARSIRKFYYSLRLIVQSIGLFAEALNQFRFLLWVTSYSASLVHEGRNQRFTVPKIRRRYCKSINNSIRTFVFQKDHGLPALFLKS
jgi:hypothetical protein